MLISAQTFFLCLNVECFKVKYIEPLPKRTFLTASNPLFKFPPKPGSFCPFHSYISQLSYMPSESMPIVRLYSSIYLYLRDRKVVGIDHDIITLLSDYDFTPDL